MVKPRHIYELPIPDSLDQSVYDGIEVIASANLNGTVTVRVCLTKGGDDMLCHDLDFPSVNDIWVFMPVGEDK